MSEFQVRLNRRDIEIPELLADLNRVAALNQRSSVTREQYDNFGQFGATTILRKLGTWNQALAQAGLPINNRQNIAADDLFRNIANVWTSMGRQPFGRNMNELQIGSEYSLGTYERRFGSWNKALIAFSNHLTSSTLSEEKHHTVDVCPSPRKYVANLSPRGANWRLRATILIRDACTCCMCGASPARDLGTKLHVDHIIPWSKGGETVEYNLRTLCERCNIGRSNVL